MRKLLILVLLFIAVVAVSNYTLEQESNTKLLTFDTLATLERGEDSMYYVVDQLHDTVDWWGYYHGMPCSKRHIDSVKLSIDSLAYQLGYTPYIGYTLLNPDFFDYYGRAN